jgi:hypothetical protein
MNNKVKFVIDYQEESNKSDFKDNVSKTLRYESGTE